MAVNRAVIAVTAAVVLVGALTGIGAEYAYAAKVKQRTAARATINTYLAQEAAVKKVLPYYAPTTTSDDTWFADFWGIGCGIEQHNFDDVTGRIGEATDQINKLDDGLASYQAKHKSVAGLSASVSLLLKNQQTFQVILSQNEQFRQLALDEFGNDCAHGRTFSPAVSDQHNATAAQLTAQMRLEAGQIEQNDDQIKAELQ